MKKEELFNAFDHQISKKSIVRRDDEYVIEGKFCVIVPKDSSRWDVWIHNHANIARGLGRRKILNIASILFKSEACESREELTGEAYGVVAGVEIIIKNLKLLGIKKKQSYSPEAMDKMRARMTRLRDCQITGMPV